MHKCRFAAQINDYLDDRLAAVAKQKFEEHLKICSSCSEGLEQLRKLRVGLKAWQVPEAGKGFESSVQNKIVAWELERGDQKMKTKPSAVWVPVGAIAGAVICLFVAQLYLKVGIKPQARIKTEAPVQLAKNIPVAPANVSQVSQVPISATQTLAAAALKHVPAVMEKAIVTRQDMKAVTGFALKESLVANDVMFNGSRAFGMARGAYDLRMSVGEQYSLQSEFFEEEYSRIYEDDFLSARENPLSTFSIDVDTASYTNVRRFLNNNQLPPPDAVRIEEMINYFTYDYPQPAGSDPFSINTEVASCPWNAGHKLVLIGLQGKKLDDKNLPPSNLVFLIDVSGSMRDYNKLPLLKSAFQLLVDRLRPQDKISIVVYAGSAHVALDLATGAEKAKIMSVIEGLSADGSTAGASGLTLAYEIAKKNLIKDGNNRVILATDGDFNVGVTSDGELVRMIEERRESGVFLTILGFGMGNYKDAKMEQLADKGNGNTAYIDNLLEVKKVFVTQLTGTLFNIAKDVKIQVEFNPAKIKAYRLIGYENRKLQNKDFNDDKKDAGELGSGHSVTALYEIVTADSQEEPIKADELKYQQVKVVPSDDLFTVKLRYKDPDGDASKLLAKTVNAKQEAIMPSENFRWASGVAEFGLLLRNSQYKANAGYQQTLDWLKTAKGTDSDGYRADLIKLVEIAQMLDAVNVKKP